MISPEEMLEEMRDRRGRHDDRRPETACLCMQEGGASKERTRPGTRARELEGHEEVHPRRGAQGRVARRGTEKKAQDGALSWAHVGRALIQGIHWSLNLAGAVASLHRTARPSTTSQSARCRRRQAGSRGAADQSKRDTQIVAWQECGGRLMRCE